MAGERRLFKIDENLPNEIGDLLRAAGHDAHTVKQQGLGGAADPRVADVCRREGRVLVTLDLDFADIRHYPPPDYPGLIVLRLAAQDKPHVLRVFSKLPPILEREPIIGHLWIVDEGAVRIRGGGAP